MANPKQTKDHKFEPIRLEKFWQFEKLGQTCTSVSWDNREKKGESLGEV